jgi:formylglycine-generating enzyme required for sulfatase activity
MVYLGGGTWVDIYLASDDGAGGLASAYNATPITGTEGLCWYDFEERFLVSGKRLLTYQEWCQAALGSPQGNDANNTNAWSATTNTARAKTGNVALAVSSIGCRDCVGNVYEWLDEFITRYDASGTGAAGSYAWQNVLGAGNGQAYMNAAIQLIALFAGGGWSSGVYAGPRTVLLSGYPWHVNANIGSRGACDSL